MLRSQRVQLLMAVLYALLFEELDIRLSKTYHYGDGYTLMLGHVPLVLALAWTVILYTSMHILDCGPLSAPARAYGDVLLVLLLDLSIDAIGAIPTPQHRNHRAKKSLGFEVLENGHACDVRASVQAKEPRSRRPLQRAGTPTVISAPE
jgi:hypothetical protein